MNCLFHTLVFAAPVSYRNRSTTRSLRSSDDPLMVLPLNHTNLARLNSLYWIIRNGLRLFEFSTKTLNVYCVLFCHPCSSGSYTAPFRASTFPPHNRNISAYSTLPSRSQSSSYSIYRHLRLFCEIWAVHVQSSDDARQARFFLLLTVYVHGSSQLCLLPCHKLLDSCYLRFSIPDEQKVFNYDSSVVSFHSNFAFSLFSIIILFSHILLKYWVFIEQHVTNVGLHANSWLKSSGESMVETVK